MAFALCEMVRFQLPQMGNKMNIYLDCEFNGFNGQLLSMAMVANEGKEFYEVLPLPEIIDPWVAENVVPKFGKDAISKYEFQSKFRAFLNQFDLPNIRVDWYVDLQYFFNEFNGKDYSSSFAYACKTEIQLIDSLNSQVPHHALWDARALRSAWQE